MELFSVEGTKLEHKTRVNILANSDTQRGGRNKQISEK